MALFRRRSLSLWANKKPESGTKDGRLDLLDIQGIRFVCRVLSLRFRQTASAIRQQHYIEAICEDTLTVGVFSDILVLPRDQRVDMLEDKALFPVELMNKDSKYEFET